MTVLRKAALVVASVAWLPSCGPGGSGGRSSQFVTLSISPATPYRFPSTSDPEFTENNSIVITFSKAVDPTTVFDPAQPGGTTSSIRFLDEGGARTNGHVFLGGVDFRNYDADPNNNAAQAYPQDGPQVLRFVADVDSDLSTPESFAAQQVTVEIGRTLRSTDGEYLGLDACSTYVVGLQTQNPPPSIVATIPPPNAGEIPLNQEITVFFSEEIDPISIIGNGTASFPSGVQLTGFNVPSGIPLPPGFFPGRIVQATRGNLCAWKYVPDSPYPGQTIITFSVLGDETPPVIGVTDTLGGHLAGGTQSFSFTTTVGPVVANSPIPPNAVFFGAIEPDRFGCIGVNTVTDSNGRPFLLVDTDGDQVQEVEDDNLISPNSENTFLGRILDIQVGAHRTYGNFLDDPPAINPPAPPPLNGTQQTTPGICPMTGLLLPNRTNADLGNNIYVTDADNNVIHVICGQNSQFVTDIPTPDPTRIAVDPEFHLMFVTNFAANTVSVIDIDQNSPTEHQVVKTIPVGLGPKGIAVTPNKEDILVLNTAENSMSIISFGSLSVRKTVATLIGPDPADISVTNRGFTFPFGTGTYFAFLANRGGNNVSIFESGPSEPLFLGPDDIIQVFTEGPNAPFLRPTAVVDDREVIYFPPNQYYPGCYFVTEENRSLCHLKLTYFAAPPMPPFPNIGALREFKVLAQTDPLDPGNPIGITPSDLCCGDNIFLCAIIGPFANRKDLTNNSLTQIQVRRIYVANSGEGTVSVVDGQGFRLQTRITIPGIRHVASYYP